MGRRAGGGGTKLENVFQEIRMEQGSATEIHERSAGDAA